MQVTNAWQEITSVLSGVIKLQNKTGRTLFLKVSDALPTNDDDVRQLDYFRNGASSGEFIYDYANTTAKLYVRGAYLEDGDTGELNVIEMGTNSSGLASGAVNKPYYRKMYLSTNELIKNMAVDGSVIEQKFVIKPNAGEIIRLERLIIIVVDAGTFDAGNWGNGVIMTNGMEAQLKQGGVMVSLTGLNPVRTTSDMSAITYDSTYHSFGQGNNYMVFRFTFSKAGQPFRLIGDNDDEFAVVIRDDLTDLVEQTMMAQGSFEGDGY